MIQNSRLHRRTPDGRAVPISSLEKGRNLRARIPCLWPEISASRPQPGCPIDQVSSLAGRASRDRREVQPYPFSFGIRLDLNGGGLPRRPCGCRCPVVAQQDLGPGHRLVSECLVERPQVMGPNEFQGVLGFLKSFFTPTQDHQHPGKKPGTPGNLQRASRKPPVEPGSFSHFQHQTVLLRASVLNAHQGPGVIEAADRDGSMLCRIQVGVGKGDIGHRPRVPSGRTDGPG